MSLTTAIYECAMWYTSVLTMDICNLLFYSAISYCCKVQLSLDLGQKFPKSVVRMP